MLLTVSDFAKRCGVCYGLIYKRIHTGDLPHVVLAGRYLIDSNTPAPVVGERGRKLLNNKNKNGKQWQDKSIDKIRLMLSKEADKQAR